MVTASARIQTLILAIKFFHAFTIRKGKPLQRISKPRQSAEEDRFILEVRYIYIYTYTFSSSNVWSNNSSAVWNIGEPFRICFRRTDRSFLFSFERLVLVICLPPRDVDPLTNRRAVTRHLFLSATRQLFLPREEEEDEEDEVDDDTDLTLGRKIRQSSLVIFVPRKVDSEISGPIRKSRRTRRSERDTLGTNTM